MSAVAFDRFKNDATPQLQIERLETIIRRLQRENAELKEEIALLNKAANSTDKIEDFVARFAFPFTHSDKKIIAILYYSRAKYFIQRVNVRDLVCIYAKDTKVLNVHLSHIRKKSKDLGLPIEIESQHGVGIRLSVASRRWLDTLMKGGDA